MQGFRKEAKQAETEKNKKNKVILSGKGFMKMIVMKEDFKIEKYQIVGVLYVLVIEKRMTQMNG